MTIPNRDFIADVRASQETPEGRRERGIVEAAKTELAPTRAAALQGISDFSTLGASVRPQYDAALLKYEQGVREGKPERQLWNYIQEGYKLIDTASGPLRQIVADIDSLTPYGISQGWHLAMPGRLNLALANIGSLRSHAALLPARVRDQERLLTGTVAPLPSPLSLREGKDIKDAADEARRADEGYDPRITPR